MKSKAKILKQKRHKEYCIEKVSQRLSKSSSLIIGRKKTERSPTEKRIEEFLMKNEVRFIPEYFTKYCFSQKTNHLLFFDFFLPDYNAVIEFDGYHHYKPIYGEDKLAQQKYKDRRKDKYCLKRGIKLLRIPYWQGGIVEEIISKFFDKHF